MTTLAVPRLDLGLNLTHGLLDRLGEAIVGGDFDNIPFPTEAELSRQHGVSRSVTREAVKMLTAKGMVSARPRQGIRVEPEGNWNLFDPLVLRWILARRSSLTLLKHFSQLRLAIEPAAAALAAEAANPAGLAAINAGHARMTAAEAGLDDPLASDLAFHIAILDASGNPFFTQFREVVSTALESSIRYTNRIVGRTADLAAHGRVRDAIVAGKPKLARQCMSEIISDALDAIIRSTTTA